MATQRKRPTARVVLLGALTSLACAHAAVGQPVTSRSSTKSWHSRWRSSPRCRSACRAARSWTSRRSVTAISVAIASHSALPTGKMVNRVDN